MAYEPHTWVADELITHEKLNHMETGIAGSVPPERTVNNKALSSNITLSASDVNAVPTSRKINGQPLTSDINIETGGGVGKSLAGQSVKPTSEATVTAGTGSEIFNDYRERTFSSGGTANHGNVASGQYSHAEGEATTASDWGTHAEGIYSIASGQGSHAEGAFCTASGQSAHVEGTSCEALGDGSHAGGAHSTARGEDSFSQGYLCVANAKYQTVIGAHNVESTNVTDKFIIGNGGTVAGSNSNCFRVTHTGTFASGSYSSSGADYAEMFEWADNNPTNEDRRGLFVTLDGDRIRIAKPYEENIIGIVSGNPTVLGDVYDDQWQGMYMTDIFGSPVWEDVEVPDQTMERPDPEHLGNTITEVVIPAHTEHRQKINPNYDNTQKYKARTERPEWAPVGLIGKLVAVDDGTCEPGGYCTVGYDDGVATASYEETRYYVMSRIDNTHIRVFIKAH